MSKDTSNIIGTLDRAISARSSSLNQLRTKLDIYMFLDVVYQDLNESAMKYLKSEVVPKVDRLPFPLAYQYIYNIWLAGLSGCKIGRKF